MGVIVSCISQCFSIFNQRKKNKNADVFIPLLEVRNLRHEKSVERKENNVDKQKNMNNDNFPDVNKGRSSLKEKNTKEEEDIIFFTPKNSYKNKNVKFSFNMEEKYQKESNLNEKLIPNRDSNKSLGSNKSLDFFSCKENESFVESNFHDDKMKIECRENIFVFDVNKLKNFANYQNFIFKINNENLEILEMSNISNYLISENNKTYNSFLPSNTHNLSSNEKSMLLIYENNLYEAKFFLDSELSLDGTRTFNLKGEFVLQWIPENFLYFISEEDVEAIFLNIENEILLGVYENYSVYFSNIKTIFGNLGCNFLFCKSYFHDQNQLCEMKFSLSNEEIIKEVKKDKIYNNFMNYDFGTFHSKVTIENDPFLNDLESKIKIKMNYRINYKQNFPVSLAKLMFSNQTKLFFEKIKKKNK